MTKYRTRAAALIAAGAVAGGASAATLSARAAEDTGSSSSSSATAGDLGPGGPGAPGGRGEHGHGWDTAALAKALGVSESKLTAALEAVREATGPDADAKPSAGEKPAPPTDAERTQRETAFAKALAKELGISQSKVTDALETVRAAEQADRRQDLADRLDDAVSAGDLTAADKASVLKAYDAGVLGGPR